MKLHLILFLLVFTSCVSADFTCPYVLSDSEIVLEEGGKRKLTFSFSNCNGEDIDSFSISFDLYDSDGNNPFLFSNRFSCTFLEGVLSQEKKVFDVDLSPYESAGFVDCLRLDSFFVREIRYSNGRIWKDPYGMYCSMEEFE